METTTSATNNNTNNTTTTTLWTVDPIHTTVGFSIRHLMITYVRGVFEKVTGTVGYDPRRPQDATIQVEIPVASVNTREPQRDAHLRSPDFFDAEKFPTMSFHSTLVEVREGGALKVTGDLSLHGVTRPVDLHVSEVTHEQKDHNGLTRIGASATAKLKRSDFGIMFNRVLEAGGVALADEVSLNFDVSLIKAAAR